MLKEGTQAKVRYTKEVSPRNDRTEVTERVIIPTRLPRPQNIKALDVTALSDEERKSLEAAWEAYGDYISIAMRALFTFENFCDHTSIEIPEVKWRTFKSSQLEEL